LVPVCQRFPDHIAERTQGRLWFGITGPIQLGDRVIHALGAKLDAV
jgi:hypothetical protein